QKAGLPEVKADFGELFLPSTSGQKLPLGVYCRF
ncbi:MAG: oxidoreductase, partial [Chitinophagales bacterium]|nr:oxidoreductase [Chitinophagales bacterium]